MTTSATQQTNSQVLLGGDRDIAARHNTAPTSADIARACGEQGDIAAGLYTAEARTTNIQLASVRDTYRTACVANRKVLDVAFVTVKQTQIASANQGRVGNGNIAGGGIEPREIADVGF